MTELTQEELAIAREYDLTSKVIPFLDRHLSYPILDSLRELYGDEAIDGSIFELFKDTNMIQFLQNQYIKIHGNDKNLPIELSKEQEEKITKKFNELKDSTSKILSILNQSEVQEHLKQDKVLNREYLSKEFEVTDEQINELYEFGQFQYNRGDYVFASDLLSNFRALSTNVDMCTNATWGKLASDIIRLEWDSAIKELKNLRDVVDSRSNFTNPLIQLHNKVWIIHWSLFPFFNNEDGLEQLLELFFSSSYLSTIQAASPWILRYLVVAVVCSESSSNKNNLSLNPNFQKRLKDLIKVVKQEEYEYRDPLTDFIKSLYIDYDFKEANLKLIEASNILKTDFFLTNLTETFLINSRHLISEVYCKVHQRINLNDISKSLNLNKEEGEKLIANLIKDTKMDAKIDESEGTVILNHPTTSVYQQVIEKTKGLSFKANQILVTALQKDIN